METFQQIMMKQVDSSNNAPRALTNTDTNDPASVTGGKTLRNTPGMHTSQHKEQGIQHCYKPSQRRHTAQEPHSTSRQLSVAKMRQWDPNITQVLDAIEEDITVLLGKLRHWLERGDSLTHLSDPQHATGDTHRGT
ncbi:hypothetical protein E2C01_010650 [Portunus trituberculatus]|uniref:Uncharacterized protein n=1 Tax=Portunus trituberculatus TaxID=210409 RepID=A0A5B7D906_PORTR|nr:hypothetical protein [Portunus trituberculatus]